MSIIQREPGRFWVRLTPVFKRSNRPAIGIAWLTFGWDKDCPFRPWPQFGVDIRRDGNSGILSWVSLLGFAICVQVIGENVKNHVAKELTCAMWLHGLPSGRGWTNAVWDTLRLVADDEFVELASDNHRAAYYAAARACGEDPEEGE